MKNLKTRFLLAVVILIISFGNEADSKPLCITTEGCRERDVSYAEEATLNEATSDEAKSELRHKQRDFVGYPEELPKEVAPEKKEKADEKKSDEARDFRAYREEDAPEKVKSEADSEAQKSEAQKSEAQKSEADSEARISKPDPAASNDGSRKNEWMEQKTKKHRNSGDGLTPDLGEVSDAEFYKNTVEAEIFWIGTVLKRIFGL